MDKLQKITAIVVFLLLLSLLVINALQLKVMFKGVGFGFKKKPCSCDDTATTEPAKFTEGAVSDYGPIS